MKHCAIFFIVVVGLVLWSATVLRAETTAYIASGGADEVLRVIVESEATLATTVDGTPYGVAVTPDGQWVLVSRIDDDAVAFIDADDFSATPTEVAVGALARGVAVDPTGTYAYVANFDDDTITEIIVSSQTVNETIDVEDGPWGVAVHYDADAKHPIAYVANHNGDSLTVVDDDGQTTIANVGNGPTGVAVTPDGAYVYVANTFADTLAVIDTAENTVIDTISVGDEPWGVAVGGDGSYVYVTNSADDTVTVIRSPEHTIVDTYRVGDTPRGVSAPRNANYAFVVNQNGDSVSIVDMDEDAVTEIAAGSIDDGYGLGVFIGDAPPDRPSGLEATAQSETAIDLSWVDNSDNERGFKIERSAEDEENYVQIATVSEDTTAYSDYGLASDTVYYYRVRAYVDAADSDYSGSAETATSAYTGSFWCFIGAMIGP